MTPRNRRAKHEAVSDRSAVSAFLLTDSQRRIIGSSLRVVEDQALACRRLLCRTETGYRLVRYHDEYSAERARELLAMLESLLATVYALAETAGVPPAHQSVRREFSAHLSCVWETLEDLRPRGLRGYGAVDPAAGSRLERLVDEATDEIRRMLDHARGRAADPTE